MSEEILHKASALLSYEIKKRLKVDILSDTHFDNYFYGKYTNYDVIMMNTEKSLNGKNWNVFLYTLNQLLSFTGKFSLGDYAYHGDKLKIKNTNYENDKYVLFENELQTEYPILQNDGIDIEDRIAQGIKIIKLFLNTPPL